METLIQTDLDQITAVRLQMVVSLSMKNGN